MARRLAPCLEGPDPTQHEHKLVTRANLEVSPATGEKVSELISGIYRSSPQIVEAAKKAIE